MLQLPIYLDHSATTPCDPQVVEAMLPWFSKFYGNAASRSHSFGWQAAEAVDMAREQIAALVNAEPNEIVFTSGATEAANLAIKGVFEAYASKGNHIITCVTEHKAVIDTCKHLEKQGADITWLGVNEKGNINLEELESSIKKETILVALMFANNETGNIMPVKEVGAIAKKHGVIFFSDATQAIGKILVDVQHDDIDLMAFSAHKFYGPKGIGALYVRRKNPRVKPAPLLHGGGHEKGLRSGTLNVPGIVGFGKAAEIAMQERETNAMHFIVLRDKLEKELLATGNVYINGNPEHRLPHVTNLSFKSAESEALLMGINKEIAVSTGSACTSASLEPSYVLKAMGISDELAHSSLRFSLGKNTTEEEIDYTIKRIREAVGLLREMSNA